MTFGHDLKHASKILYNLAIRMTNTVQKELLKTRAHNFQHLRNIEWGKKVTRQFLVAMQTKKTWNIAVHQRSKGMQDIHWDTRMTRTAIVSLPSTKLLSNNRPTVQYVFNLVRFLNYPQVLYAKSKVVNACQSS